MLRKFLNKLLRLVKFSSFSLVGTAVDTAVLWFCAHRLFKGYAGEYILSPVISFEISCIVNFLVFARFVWGDRLRDMRMRTKLRRAGEYQLTCTGVFLVKLAFLQIIGMTFHIDVVWANFMALMLSGLLNFIINDLVIFRNRKSYGTQTTGNEDPDFISQCR